MIVRRSTAILVLASLVTACGGGDATERTRNAAIEVESSALPFPATNVWPHDLRWSPEAERAVAYSGDAVYEGLFVGQASAVKTSDPNDESVPAAFPMNHFGVRTGVPDGKGGWYLGGSYIYIDGQSRGRMTHVRADGTVDDAFFLQVSASGGLDSGVVTWMQMHPNGSDVLVAINAASSVGGVEVENLCNQVYVIDGVTGDRKIEAEAGDLPGCAITQVVVGNRLIRVGGSADGSPLLTSVDLTTGRADDFLDDLNARYPYFSDSDFDFRYVSEIEVRGDTLWVFGNLDRAGRRIAKVDAATGALADFAAPPIQSTEWQDSQWDFAATDTHVMAQVRERDAEGYFVNVFHVFDASTGAKVPFDPQIPALSWTWPVGDVTVWRNDFLLTGQLTSAGGRPARGHVVVDERGGLAPSQLPYAVMSMQFERIEVRDFPGADRTMVTFRGSTALYDPVFTGMVLVTDKDGAPQKFRFDEETLSRDITGIGVAGKWLYVATLGDNSAEQTQWFDSRVDRFDLVTGERDGTFRADTSGRYVYDIYGSDDYLVFMQSKLVEGSYTYGVSIRLAMNGDENSELELVVEDEVMVPSQAVEDADRVFVRLNPQKGMARPVAARIDLVTGMITYASGASSSEWFWSWPALTSAGLMVPVNDRVHVIDPETMTAKGSIMLANVVDVAEIGGRLVANAPNMSEVDPATFEVIGRWGPQDFSATRLVAVGDGAISGSAQPWARSKTTVVSGVIRLSGDGSVTSLSDYQRLTDRPPADSPDVEQVVGHPVQSLPSADPTQTGSNAPVPNLPVPNVSTQRESARVAILNVAPGDRSVTVTYRPVADAAKYTVSVVGGKQSCSSASGSCTVKGLTAGKLYRFVVVPEGEGAVSSDESIAVAPWIAMKRGTSKKAGSLLKVPAKGTVTWKVKGTSCSLKGTTVTAKKKRGLCTLTVSVKTKAGTVRSSTNVSVS